MLFEFIAKHRDEIIHRCRVKVRSSMTLRVGGNAERVRIEVQDEWGGLPHRAAVE